MDKAFELAKEALDNREVPVGCVFCIDATVVSSGRNRTNESRNATRHAELEAIDTLYHRDPENFSSLMRKITVYVTVEPCVMCASALIELGVKKVYFGCWNDKFGGCGSAIDIPGILNSSKTLDNSSLQTTFTGGIQKDLAIYYLRKFYTLENDSAPNPKKKSKRTLKMDDLDL